VDKRGCHDRHEFALSETIERNQLGQYVELNRYFIEVIKFRLTILGFFVGGSLLAISQGTRNWQFYVILVIAIGMWVMELRTRIIFRELGNLGENIEKRWRTLSEQDRTNPPWGYFGRALAPAVAPSFNLLGFRARPKHWLIVERLLTHSFGIDLIYLTVVVGSLLRITKLV
jgi:hypothetical protein